MKYLLLLANDADDIASWEQLDAEAVRKLRVEEVPRWAAVFERMQADGSYVDGLELDFPRKAKTVRGDEQIVTDGPYAETKEQIGGFFLVDCASLEEAIELAAMVPVAETGSVEIRPLDE
ncbi:MAG: transcription initiation protein [Thermoleophilia bacterium]|nr:transcription initiation protein [Thermoleophilia bacterium]